MDDGLKQRLIGAVVLIAIAVIFLPSFFSGERGRRLDTRTQIPPEPEMKVVEFSAPKRSPQMPTVSSPEESYQLLESEDLSTLRVGSSNNNKNNNKSSNINKSNNNNNNNNNKPLNSDVVKSEGKISSTNPRAASKATKKSANKPVVKSGALLTEQGIPSGWVVQVGSFQSRERAELLNKRLKKDGYKAFVHKAVIHGKSVYRVLVGPKIDKNMAVKSKEKLDLKLKMNTLIREFKP